ncbi:MAG: zinc ribbon domain-containing protein [Clostridia bacterium]|nr:zinc ribbon domain-containing protein [Clostridia bacterium]
MESINHNSKKCSFCGEDIRYDAKRCPYCGSLTSLSPETEALRTVYEINADASAVLNEAADEVINSAGEDLEDNPYKRREPNFVMVGNPYDYTQEQQIAPKHKAKALSNGKKVFLTALSTIIPGFGQLAGLIAAIVFLNSDEDEDRKSFGQALMVSSLIVFAINLFVFLAAALIFASVPR